MLTDEPLADVQIAAGREVAGFAPAKEAGAAMRDLEDAEGLRGGRFRDGASE
jgi:hypothetical protein